MIAAVLGPIIAVLAAGLWQARSGAQPGKPDRPVVSPSAVDSPSPGSGTIDAPQRDGSTIGSKLTVRGTVRNLPAEHVLWCFVNSGDNKWYPYRVTADGRGYWTARVGMGPDGPLREPLSLTIHLVSVPPAANPGIEAVLPRSAEPAYGGLPALPPAAERLDNVHVLRTG